MTDGILQSTAREQRITGENSKSWFAVWPTVWAHFSAMKNGGGKVHPFLFILVIKEAKLMKKIGIVIGSDSDLPIIKKATDMLESLEIPYELHIFSAHRTPEEAREFSLNARQNGFGAIIAAAGMAAHLAGAIAANTTLPVIGIPCKSQALDGMDALLSTVQMPPGIPVATVAINGGANAALIAAQILSVEDSEIARKLDEKRKKDKEAVLKKDKAVMELLNK